MSEKRTKENKRETKQTENDTYVNKELIAITDMSAPDRN